MTDQFFYTSAAGNSFLLSFDPQVDLKRLKDHANSHQQDPDGYILFDKIEDSFFRWSFINKDGGEVDFCGNALRAVGVCAQKAFNTNQISIETKAGLCEVKVLEPGSVKAQMPFPTLRKKIEAKGFGQVALIDAGVPHLLIHQSDLSQKSLKELALEIRKQSLEDEAQTYNLTFYSHGEPLPCVTYERGVEDFTLACGSGAMALAFLKKLEKEGFDFIELKMPGGLLEVSFEEGKAFMKGPAQIDKQTN